MALIDCSECSKQVSDKATSCPNCGAPTKLKAENRKQTLEEKKRPLVRPVFLVLAAIAAILVWRSFNSESTAPASEGLSGLIRKPNKVVNEKIELDEGQYMFYSLLLEKNARVQVQVSASPRKVDVVFLSQSELEVYRDVLNGPPGKTFSYLPSLSSENVLRMDKSFEVSAGSWAIVIRRPNESILFTDKTAAEIIVTIY
jgi:hypothetical protein